MEFFPRIFHYKAIIGGDPGMDKLSEALGLTQEDRSLWRYLGEAML